MTNKLHLVSLLLCSVVGLASCVSEDATSSEDDSTTSQTEHALRMSLQRESVAERLTVLEGIQTIEDDVEREQNCSDYGDCTYCEYRTWHYGDQCAQICVGWACYVDQDVGGYCYQDCSYWI